MKNIKARGAYLSKARLIGWIKYKTSLAYRLMFESTNHVPDLVIVGMQKCGTTSLYSALVERGLASESLRKEIHYFDMCPEKSQRWYSCHFKDDFDNIGGKKIKVDASPSYMLVPDILRRISREMPESLMIALLRNPVERSISHYYHSIKRGYETRSLDEAMFANEGDIILNPSEAELEWARKFAYKNRSRYFQYLSPVEDLIQSGQLKIILSEDFFSNQDKAISDIFEALQVSGFATRASSNTRAWSNRGIYKRQEIYVIRAQRAGHQVHVWTVDDPIDVELCSRLQVDAVITNRPQQVLSQLSDLGRF